MGDVRKAPAGSAKVAAIKDSKAKQVAIRGTAALYFSVDDPDGTEYLIHEDDHSRIVERILPGAFAHAVDGGADVRAVVNGLEDTVLGGIRDGKLRVWEDDDGLHYEITTAAKKAVDQAQNANATALVSYAATETRVEVVNTAAKRYIYRYVLAARLEYVGSSVA